MARQNVDIGVQGNDGTGDSIRESFRKVNDNFIQLFAIFGSGDTISFTDLDDTPTTYDADQVIVANFAGDALVSKNLVGGEGIAVDHSDENEIRIISTGGKVGNDIKPQLGGHLNAQNFSIGNLAEPSDETAALFNDLHDTSITSDDLVISKGYADQRYLQASGGPGAGSQVRVRTEPPDTSEYTVVIDNWVSGYALIPEHNFNSGSNGISYKYLNEGSTPATGLINGQTYYLRYLDKNRMGVFPTREDAVDGTNRIIVNDSPEVNSLLRGLETFLDANYDSTLAGNWVSNEALPRVSVVRRQGDTMTGELILSDHPGSLAGAGSPNGADDLQAATKYYVDNSSFASATNLFVAVNGDDEQTLTPPGKEGRAFAYAYATVNAACRKAEEIINSSLAEPGPYRQQLTFGNYVNNAYLSSVAGTSGTRRSLFVYTGGQGVDQSKDPNNRDLREGSIVKGLRSGATGKVIQYTLPSGLTDTYLVDLLLSNTDITYFQTDYKYASEKLLDNEDFITAEVVEYIKTKYPSLVFDETLFSTRIGLIVDAIAFDIKYGGNTKAIKVARSYWNGMISILPLAQRGPTVDGINYINLLAQDIIDNVTIPAASGVGYGTRSDQDQVLSSENGEGDSAEIISRLITSITNIVTNGTSGDGTLLEFLVNEPLEFGQLVPEVQITVRIETGIYYEQMPIRVPTNVSIKGDEFRRVIIRPAPGVSTSPWAGIYFYRDSDFDGLTRTYIGTSAVSSYVAPGVDPLNLAGYYKVTVASTTGAEVGMYLYKTAGAGTFAPTTTITRIISSTEFEIAHAPLSAITGATIRGLNSTGLAPVGSNFGYHYLTDPTGLSGIFDETISKTSGNVIAAGLLTAGKTSIQAGVISYINSTYPELDYDSALCYRDVGYIVDAVVYDLTNGGTSRSIAAGQSYFSNISSAIAITTQLNQTVDGIDRINTLAQAILTDPSAEVGSEFIVADLINGIINTIVGVNNPPKANKDMDVFLLNDGTILRNITAQGHGGFMCVLDPEGQIQTKSPYFQTATSLSGSTNKHRFAGGMFIDGFSGNLPATIFSKNSNTELVFSGLTVRAPLVPTSFYIDGDRYQINAVEDYNRSAGTATITLDIGTPFTDSVPSPINIVVETAGNRSMLSNDFTQVNDLGYGLVATNNGIAEAVSVFTYYNWTSYFASNGGQIRSLNGSSCNGVYGLKARGSDPNEIPDPVTLADTIVQNVKIFSRDAFASKNKAGDLSIYIDSYTYVPGTEIPSIYNVSELEIDHTNAKSRLVENTPSATTNVTIFAAGTGYSVGQFIFEDSLTPGTLYTGGAPARFKVAGVDGGGGVTAIEVVDAGLYAVNPVGGYPTNTGTFETTAESGGGTGCVITGTFLGDITRYEVTNIETTSSYGEGVDPLAGGILFSDGSFVIGTRYVINTVGTSDFTTIGATSNDVGVVFVATQAATSPSAGTGNAKQARVVIKLNLNTVSTSSLEASLVDGQVAVIRGLQNFRFNGVQSIRPVRPSTALQFTDVSEAISVYRTLSYNLAYPTGVSLLSTLSISTVARALSVATIVTTAAHGLSSGDIVSVVCTSNTSFNATSIQVTVIDSTTFTYLNAGIAITTTSGAGTVSYGNQAILTFDNSYDHVIIQSDIANMSGGYGSSAGDTKLAVVPISSSTTITRLNCGLLLVPEPFKVFCWDGRMHEVTRYYGVDEAAPGTPAHIVFTTKAFGQGTNCDPTLDPVASGLRSGLNTVSGTTLRASLQKDAPAEITVEISTCRATGHDFLDIGSGSFNSTNYPNNLLGSPETSPQRANEVVEETAGRVFYVSTDQFGIFRVGKFFTVDQGTGSVTFAASIALSNLDGLGFKRGTVVKEFSTDVTMTDNADDSVPVESAIRGYIEKRLGYTHTGAVIPAADRIPAGTGGFLSVYNSPTLNADLDMTSNRITFLATPIDISDASTKGYVDTQVTARDSWYKLKDVLLMTPSANDIPVFIGGGRAVISSSLSGDITGTLTSTNLTTLTTAITGTSQLEVNLGVFVDNTTGFPASGYFQIGSEIFSYSSITPSNKFDGVSRAAINTTAATYTIGTQVRGLDNSRYDLQIAAEVIVNADISATAAIAQSKLNLTDVTAFVDTATTSVLGKASFSSDNFAVNTGVVTIKDGGVALAEIVNIAAGSILGNLTGAAAAPQEVSTSGIVANGIDSLFTTIDNGANVLTRRFNSLKTTSTLTSVSGTPVSGSGTYTDVSATNITGSGNGARVTVTYSAGTYTGVTVVYGGNGYAEGDQLTVVGTLLGGTSPANDVNFTVAVTGTNIDAVVYLGLERVSQTAAADSLVKTDGLSNLGDATNKFNNVYATRFHGALTGNVTGNADTATKSTNLIGSVVGSIPYQSAADTTTLLAPGVADRYLKSQGAGLAPVWNEIIIPDGDANTLTGTTLASGVVNSSLTSVGTLTSLTVSGLAAFSVDASVTAAGSDLATATLLSKSINIVTAGTGGVKLPVAVVGYRVIVRNNTAASINLYANTGAAIGSGLAGDAVLLEANAALEYFCSVGAVAGSGGQWYNLNAVFA